MLHPFPLFLSLSSFSFSCKRKHYLPIYLPIYVSFICVMFVTYANTAFFTFIPLSLLVSSFQCFVWIYIRFRSVPLSLSLSSSTDTPHPTFTVQNRWLPHSLIFLFFSFSKFFISKIFLLKKCGIIYLHLWCVFVGMECLHLVVVCV